MKQGILAALDLLLDIGMMVLMGLSILVIGHLLNKTLRELFRGGMK